MPNTSRLSSSGGSHHETVAIDEPPSPAKLRWWIACFVSAIILSPVISVLLGLNLHAHDFQDNEEGARNGFTGRTVSCIAQINILMDIVIFRLVFR